MFDFTLFNRSLSQALQASLGVAFCLCWAQRTGRASVARGIRWGVAAAAPATAVATWLFGQTNYQARWEATLATITLAAAAWFATVIVAGVPEPASSRDDGDASRTVVLVAIGAAVAIVRQTMEIGVVLRVAIVDLHSIAAVAAIAAGTGAGLMASYAWVAIGRRLRTETLLKATRVFAVLFVAQVALYAFHESAEARWLPWSDVLHAATEPYGPDSTFGLYVTGALLVLPALTAGAMVFATFVMDPITTAAALGTLGIGCVAAIVSTTGIVSTAGGVQTVTASTVARPVTHDPERFLGSSRILFRHIGGQVGETGRMAVASLDAPDGARATGSLACARVSFGLDRGICLQPREGAQSTYDAVIFDAAWRPLHKEPLVGGFSRTRTSSDGRFGAATTFTSESHGYAAASFSTRTILLDMRRETVIGDLEQFAIVRGGRPFKAADFNFWGVTFAASDSNTFYATLRSNKTHYLVRGNIAERRATVIAEDVECPSLSPDERRIAFKRRVGPDPSSWRLYVLDLATMTDRIVTAAAYYVDDQVEWLDADHILYAMAHLGTADVWVAPIDGAEQAHVLIHDADSPIVVREPSRLSTPSATTH
jgi:hypothetical protein